MGNNFVLRLQSFKLSTKIGLCLDVNDLMFLSCMQNQSTSISGYCISWNRRRMFSWWTYGTWTVSGCRWNGIVTKSMVTKVISRTCRISRSCAWMAAARGVTWSHVATMHKHYVLNSFTAIDRLAKIQSVWWLDVVMIEWVRTFPLGVLKQCGRKWTLTFSCEKPS